MIIICPACRRKTTWEENPWRPFCSERCKLVDFDKWVEEEYSIAGDKKKNMSRRKRKKVHPNPLNS
jgi:hypothetical protein